MCWGNLRVEELRPGGHPQFVDVEQESPRQAEALVDVVALVEVGVVDEPLPPHDRSRLLEICPHDHDHGIGQIGRRCASAARRNRAPRCRIVDRAGPRDDHQAVLPAPRAAATAARASATMFDARSLIGSSSSRMAGGMSGRTSRMRRSSVRRNIDR